MASSNKPHFGQFMADVPRLSSGHACSLLLMYFWARVEGRDDGWSTGMTFEELLQYCRLSDPESVGLLLADLESRGLIDVRRFDDGQFSIRLKMEDWEALPDYSGKGPVR